MSRPPSPALVLNGYPLGLAGEGIGVYARRLTKGLERHLEPHSYKILLPSPMAQSAAMLPESLVELVDGNPPFGGRQFFQDIYWASRLGVYAKNKYSGSVFHALREYYAWQSPRKTVTTIHDCNHWRFPASKGSLLRSWWRRATEYFARCRSPLTLTVSNWARRDLVAIAKIPEEKIRVVYNWVDPDLSAASARSRLPDVRQRHQLPERYFLYVGGFSANKNVDTLLRAYASASARMALPDLVIAGDLAQYQRSQKRDFWETIRRLAVPREKIRSTGFVPGTDLPALMSGADLLVYPSKSEGFGYPPVEAIAVGTPVIVANATSLKEVVRREICRFDPENDNDLAEKLVGASRDPSHFACELPEEFTEAYGVREYLKVLREGAGLEI